MYIGNFPQPQRLVRANGHALFLRDVSTARPSSTESLLDCALPSPALFPDAQTASVARYFLRTRLTSRKTTHFNVGALVAIPHFDRAIIGCGVKFWRRQRRSVQPANKSYDVFAAETPAL